MVGKLDLLGPNICDALGTIQDEINSACECMPDITMSPTSSRMPSNTPSLAPIGAPSSAPSAGPSVEPSLSANPTAPSATSSPTSVPSKKPSQIPSQSADPTAGPTSFPSNMPSQTPTVTPGNEPCDICPAGEVSLLFKKLHRDIAMFLSLDRLTHKAFRLPFNTYIGALPGLFPDTSNNMQCLGCSRQIGGH